MQKKDCTGKKGIHPLVRLVSCFRILSYGDSSDRSDEYLQISGTVASDSFKEFCRLIVEKFGSEYLNRCPTDEEKEQVLSLMKRRGFPGCFASWDCKHFIWEKCPLRLAGQHKGGKVGKALILEAISDPYLYIWYSFFGEPGSLNDLNVLDKSTIIGAILRQSFNGKVNPYVINGRARDWLYFLVDGIYPKLSIFCKTLSIPLTDAQRKYSKRHESVRKDVERAFGVLVQRFGILKRPIRNWYLDDIKNIVSSCIILHNMTIELNKAFFIFNDEQHENNATSVADDEEVPNVSLFSIAEDNDGDGFFQQGLAARVAHMAARIEDTELHQCLQEDLVSHIWNR